ncbi:hypothetical protein SDC9_172450 [bioreactor metagenome]|uniref:Uncharacterized protein n=1 Tax=bioreactor metagenome TaxID=1076179 RepID=A0A645GMV8_9ZZZZ
MHRSEIRRGSVARAVYHNAVGISVGNDERSENDYDEQDYEHDNRGDRRGIAEKPPHGAVSARGGGRRESALFLVRSFLEHLGVYLHRKHSVHGAPHSSAARRSSSAHSTSETRFASISRAERNIVTPIMTV